MAESRSRGEGSGLGVWQGRRPLLLGSLPESKIRTWDANRSRSEGVGKETVKVAPLCAFV